MKIREPRTCIFCNSFRISDEHFWPEWCHHLFERGVNDSYRQFQEDTIPGRRPRKRHDRTRGGNIVTKAIRCVCKPCNNGWMSQLESAAKPILAPMIEGKSRTLDADQRRTLASWVALKVMVSEHDKPRMALTPDHDRLVFYEALGIPRYYRIRIGRNGTKAKLAYHRQSMTLALGGSAPEPSPSAPVPPLGMLRKNVQVVSFLMGEVFIHATAARVDDFDLDNVIRQREWGIHLFPEKLGELLVAWPTQRALSKRDLGLLANMLETLDAQPRYRWGGFLTEEDRKEWESEG